MRVVIAPDKLKGSLSAPAAAEAIARGVRAALPEAEIDLAPMADGGEGIVEALVASTSGTFHEAGVTGPLGEPVRARFGMLGDGRTAVIEMAAASGLVLVPHARRDPLRASTRGTGELLLAAMGLGARRIILGIGGSATNDGGAGLGQALGFRLLDERGSEIGPGGGSLESLAWIDSTGRDPRLANVEIAIACDVDNPLCGPRGASAIYGPQKGASPDQIKLLDRNLHHFARIVARDLGIDVRDQAGAGAAGGWASGSWPSRAGGWSRGGAGHRGHRARRATPPRRSLPDRRRSNRRLQRLRQGRRGRCPAGSLVGLSDLGAGRRDRARGRGCPEGGHRRLLLALPWADRARRGDRPRRRAHRGAAEQAVRGVSCRPAIGPSSTE